MLPIGFVYWFVSGSQVIGHKVWTVINQRQHGSDFRCSVRRAAMPGSHIAQNDGARGSDGLGG